MPVWNIWRHQGPDVAVVKVKKTTKINVTTIFLYGKPSSGVWEPNLNEVDCQGQRKINVQYKFQFFNGNLRIIKIGETVCPFLKLAIEIPNEKACKNVLKK